MKRQEYGKKKLSLSLSLSVSPPHPPPPPPPPGENPGVSSSRPFQASAADITASSTVEETWQKCLPFHLLCMLLLFNSSLFFSLPLPSISLSPSPLPSLSFLLSSSLSPVTFFVSNYMYYTKTISSLFFSLPLPSISLSPSPPPFSLLPSTLLPLPSTPCSLPSS